MTKTQLKILFRTAGGKTKTKELGLGHVYRCINLAKKMKGVKKYFLVEDYGGAIDTIKQNSFQNIFISKKNSNLKNNVNEIKKMIYENEIDLVVVDIYKISKKFVSLIKKFVKVVVITDLKSIDYSADLLVNGFIGFNNKIESNRFNTKCLLGPKFQIIM